MSNTSSPIISTSDLIKFNDEKNLIIIDASGSNQAKENYLTKHLKGALFMDLNTQLADIKNDLSDGGRHPLPAVEVFAELLGSYGISEKSQVVIYDEKNGSNAAARLWWMLAAAGHEKVYVLDGGLEAAALAGYPLSSGQESATPVVPYPFTTWKLPQAGIEEVQTVSENDEYLVIDVRDNARYLGITEPIDLIAGHIPGAVNVPFSGNLDEKQNFLSPELLRAKYETLFAGKPAEKIIVHCGSGVTACHTLLALAHAGLAVPKLYVGSWSEWSRNGKKIATGA
ncbi:MAG: sulfurtransferase [Ferruginibacter sp.]